MSRSLDLVPPGAPPLVPATSFFASDGYELSYRLHRCVDRPRAIVVSLNGIQSHSGWYGWSAERLAHAGFAVAQLDRRGSGANQAARGDASHSDRLVHDVVQLVAHLDRLGFDRCPRVLSAISWGGKLAAATAIREPELFDALTLLTPGICARIRANALQRAAIRTAVALGAGVKTRPIPLEDPALFTDSPPHQSFIRTDPGTLRTVTLRFLAASLDLDRFVLALAPQLRIPLLIQLAGRDRIVDNLTTRRFVDRTGSPGKTVFEYPAACHTLEFEPDRDRIFDDLAAWLAARFSSHPAG